MNGKQTFHFGHKSPIFNAQNELYMTLIKGSSRNLHIITESFLFRYSQRIGEDEKRFLLCMHHRRAMCTLRNGNIVLEEE